MNGLNVLVTSVAAKVPMVKSVKNAVLKIDVSGKIFGSDIKSICVASYFVDHYWKMPPTKDEYVHDILNYCKENVINLIIPSRDGELLFWAKHKYFFKEAGIEIMIASEKSIASCVDKLLFYQVCKELNFPAIPTYTFEDFQSCDFKGNWVVKERNGAGSLNMLINVSREDAIDAKVKFSDPIFQPYVAGEEYSIDVYFTTNHLPKGAIVRKRSLVVNGESQITTTVQHPELENLCMKMGHELKLVGHNIFQAFVTHEGDLQIIECNARFGGASSLSIAAGLDSFYWFLLESNGADISEYPFLKNANPLTQVRYASDKIVS